MSDWVNRKWESAGKCRMFFIWSRKTFFFSSLRILFLPMLSSIPSWQSLIIYCLILIKPITNQGLACYKCMTTNFNNDSCRDPFSSIINPVHINCQVDHLEIHRVSLTPERERKKTLSIFVSKIISFFLSLSPSLRSFNFLFLRAEIE